MKWIKGLGAATLMLSITTAAPAGLLGGIFSSHGHHGADCCPANEQPVAVRPCPKTYTYQRQLANGAPPCAGQGACAGEACVSAPCDQGRSCLKKRHCLGNWRHRKGDLLTRLCDLFDRNHPVCHHGPDCTNPDCVGNYAPPLRCGDPQEIACLIYKARTACYADDRAHAVDKLAKFDCRCHPEIMATLVYSLNDADQRVRTQAADAIGDLIEEGRCCCSPEVVAALSCALADCDWSVRHQAEEALHLCGYQIVDGCNQGSCNQGSCNNACHAGAAGCVASQPKGTPKVLPPTPGKSAKSPAAPAPKGEAAKSKEGQQSKTGEKAPAPSDLNKTAPAPPPPKAEESEDAPTAPAPAPPAPEAEKAQTQVQPKAAPAPAPPEGAQAYFPTRYRR